jgi:glucokinase
MESTKHPLVLALDFGGTKAAAAVMAIGSAELLRHVTISTAGNADDTIAALFVAASRLLSEETPSAIGISFGGPVDTDRGVVSRSHHRPGWTELPLASRRFGAPATLLNDADAGALGEAAHGAGEGYSDVLYVTVSTGVGAGLVFDRRLRHGAHGLAGELGHLPLALNGPRCSCGRRGCLEAYASGPSIARQAREALAQASRSGDYAAGTVLRATCEYDVRGLTARQVALAASLGDPLARTVMTSAGRAIGQGCAMAALILDPDVIVLGGGVTAAGELITRPAEAVFTSRSLAPGVPIEIAQLGDACTLVGAAEAATRELLLQ